MADFFSKVKKSINKGTTVISVKSSTMIEVNKLKSEISSLKREKNEVFMNAGEKAYNMKKEGQIDLFLLEELLSRAFEIDEIIEIKESAIEEAIKNQEDTIKSLDEKENQEEHQVEGYCSCGALLSENTKFCSKCGKKIEVLEEITIEVVEPDVNTYEEFELTGEMEEIEPIEIIEDMQIDSIEEDKVCECGAILPVGTKFCIKCGKKLD